MKRKNVISRVVPSCFLALSFTLGLNVNAYADEAANVQTALVNAATEVQQAVDAANAVTSAIETATVQAQQANASAEVIMPSVDSATAAVTILNNNVATLISSSETEQLTRNSETVTVTTNAVATALQAVQILESATAQAQQELQQAIAARSAVDSATANSNTQFIQANQAIASAQSAVTALQATISTTRSVLANTDDAGILMTLPFQLRMGNTLYSSVYLGSNAVITFGTDQGYYYWTTPTVPEISVGGFDWTTWSQGSGIRYATTATSLDIAWDVRAFPTMDHSITMTQLRFNADVNPDTGAWTATVSGSGPNVDNARWNYRQANNGAITAITDLDTQTANVFRGALSQGNYTAPTNVQVDTNSAVVQQQIDSANATIAALNVTIGQVQAQNNTNASQVYTIPSTSSAQQKVTTGTNTATSLNVIIIAQSETITAVVATLPATASATGSQTTTEPAPSSPAPVIWYVDPIRPEPTSGATESQASSDQGDSSQQTQEGSQQDQAQQPAEEAGETQQQEESTAQEPAGDEGSTSGSDNTLNDEKVNDLQDALADGTVTTAEADQLIEAITSKADGELSAEERLAVASVLVAAYAADGGAVPASAMAEAGIAAKDLPPSTPVQLANGVVIVAQVQASFDTLANPSELVAVIFTDPGQVLTALTNLGADMSPTEREESQKVVVASVIAASVAVQAAAGAAVSAATTASTTSSSSSSGSSSRSSSNGDAGVPGGQEGGTVRRRRTESKTKKAVKKSGRIRRIRLRRKAR